MDDLFKSIFKGAALILVGICLNASLRAQDVVDGIAAIVNDSVITFSQVKQQVDRQEQALRDALRDNPDEMVKRVKALRLEALNALIERELILQEFKKQGFDLPDRYVEARLRETIEQQFDGNRAAFIKTLEAQGLSMQEFREDMKKNLIVQAMRQQNTDAGNFVSPFKVEAYYQENIDQFVTPDQIKLRMIFLRKGLFKEEFKTSDGEIVEKDPQLVLAQEILKKLNTGSDFSSLAQAYSEDSKRNDGGDWGWVDKNTLRKEISDVAFRLRPGQISHVIDLDEGYYIIQIENFKKGGTQSLEEVRLQIEGQILQEQRLDQQRKWIDRLKQKSYIKMF
ncbi:SurA N-terminal domain-containing protein [Oscillatoria amoena NRMC-F 0135]|nr:peptidylprolyl isomerase [Oscillatoria laete-virens]MDL5050390.1 SurA N-terminal domain-containing protein [Oscillatoria amoena NRMC-F 0135]MDL5054213.1 SurA N-terminal domain-containing protein [Oscillatoria laete-virens NRMC-F 0139]